MSSDLLRVYFRSSLRDVVFWTAKEEEARENKEGYPNPVQYARLHRLKAYRKGAQANVEYYRAKLKELGESVEVEDASA